jgi:hypothetical protein
MPSKAAGVREDLRAVALQMFNVFNATFAPRQKLAKPFLPLDEGLVAKIGAIDLQKIECQQARRCTMLAAAKRVEVRNAIRIEASDFAMDHDGLDVQ